MDNRASLDQDRPDAVADPVLLIVRVSPELKSRLKEKASTEHRTLTSQVVVMLEQALRAPAA